MDKKLIVISAVNIVEAGTLSILKECLVFLSELVQRENYRVVALVYSKDLINIPNIEYIEVQWPKKRWVNRLWFEYVTLRNLSKQLSPVYLWFSLHDTTPSVTADRRAVYCHNSYFYYKWRSHDLIFAPKIALFSIFTKLIYRTNIHKNDYLVVQQDWFRREMHKMFNFSLQKIIVAIPESPLLMISEDIEVNVDETYKFIFAGSPNSHKNFEVICRAAELLEKDSLSRRFRVCITVSGTENRYASWLYKKWGHLESIEFIGFVDKVRLATLYHESDCLIFPSKVESWGLPISEYSKFHKPMLLADLPYAHETAAGSKYTSFFTPDDVVNLAAKMKRLISGDNSFLEEIPEVSIEEPIVYSWSALFKKLLD